MADKVKVQCCSLTAASGRCSNCKDSCSCSVGCRCSSRGTQIQLQSCAGGEGGKRVCRCNPGCPCRKNGCATGAVGLNPCAATDSAGQSCTMPGNCCCDKGSVGRL